MFTVSLFFLLFSCKNHSENSKLRERDTTIASIQLPQTTFSKDTQLILYSGEITLPKGWRIAIEDTMSEVGDATSRYRFHNRNGKLIFLQYGLSTIGNPSEPHVQSVIFRRGYVSNNTDTSVIMFTDNPHLLEIRKKSNYLYSNRYISGFEATFFRPRNIGEGYTGIYIDSIGHIARNIVDLVFYSEDLDSLESEEFEKVSQSLIIKDFR
jgi:hypothetical protein